MTVSAAVADGNAIVGDADMVLLAYVGTELRGSAAFQRIPSLDQYRAILPVYSGIPFGEPVSFRVGYLSSALTYPVTPDVAVTFKADTVRGSIQAPILVRGTFADGLAQYAQPLLQGWNMVALPLVPADARKTFLYPSASSKAYRFKLGAGYLEDDTLDAGVGYWVNFGNTGQVQYTGAGVDSITIALAAGWNLVGGLSADVRVSQVLQSPAQSLASAFFYYATGYYPDTLIRAGQAYWVKTAQPCQITLKARLSAADMLQPMTELSRLSVTEVPPPPPSGVAASSSEPAALPASYALAQNYPNPFNPVTAIRYELPSESRVTLTVFNVLGQVVARLVDGIEAPGYRTVAWSAGEAASGVYFYRLEAANLNDPGQSFSLTRKMLLLR
jgi:hypothetical protein